MSSDLESINCIICNEDNCKRIHEFSFQDSKFNLVLCKNCGLGYLNPRWKKKQYSNYYKDSYDNQYRPDLKSKRSNLSLQDNNNNIILERFKKNKIKYNNAKTILDIGCGAGDNLLAFIKANHQLDCYAIESSKVSQEFLKERNINIISEDVDTDWDLECKEKFDIIIMRHVLEHFINPLDILKKVYHVLSEKGILYIAVPNNLIQNRSEGWLRVAHTFYFNQFTLKAILNKASLKINSIFLEDEFNKLEVFAFVQKNKNIHDVEEIKNVYKLQRNVFYIVFNKNKYLKIKIFIKKILLKFK